MLLKTKEFLHCWTLITLLVCWSSIVSANETWISLYSSNSFGNIVKLDYNIHHKKVLFYFDKPRVPDRAVSIEFDVKNPAAVRQAEQKLKELFGSQI